MIVNKKIVICDVNIQQNGHYIGYNQFVIDNYKRVLGGAVGDELIFVYNIEAKELLRFPEDAQTIFLDFKADLVDTLSGRTQIWKMVLSAIEGLKADMLYFLDLDKFQIPVSLYKGTTSISTIYFRPHHRTVPSNNKLKTVVNTKIKSLKKIFSEVIVIGLNKNVKNIFILNDPSGVAHLNKFYRTEKFKHLPDPIFSYDTESQSEILEKDKSEISLLAFGALAERKNTENIIRAYSVAKFSQPTVLKIIGSSKPAYFSTISRLVEEVKNNLAPNKRIILENKFVSNAEMDELHATSHISLLIYKDFFGSSGLLGRSAKHNMYVLASSVGLIQELVNKYNLGKTTDPFDVNQIAQAMEQAQNEYSHFNTDGCKRFYEEHQPDQFLKSLFLQ
ncbi:glycosyltransferase [Dyadobacter chenwenxiniae]|uniref:Glycosyltransferase n=1 Tax=Dyadobacter chenwenxiniae TaxID=2906456 RepID=A0A9X1PLQ5_9BACT|nr:glycosyltransferase [Dyadobacter chenwenxiniae]MCF0062720.1 glycosyltransferase [Dyadobacter chenwenxiniae]UON83535.1 glycosyltransferase [Dyadobacter chenwenxiniae]